MEESNTPTPTPELDPLEQVNQLLMGEDRAEVRDDQPEDAAQPEKEEEQQTTEEPEKAELDYGMKVPITGGDPVTLGELKDAWQQQHIRTQELIEREQGISKQVQHLEYLAQFFDDLPAPVMQERKQQALQYAAEQERLLHEAVPSTRTPDGAKEFLDRVASVAEQYGVERGRVHAGMDSAVLRMAYDYARLQEAVKAARANVKPLRADQPRAAQAATTKPSDVQRSIDRARQTGNKQDAADAIDKLLRSA